MRRRIKLDVDAAAELYRSGRTLDDVGAHFGVSSGTIRRRLLKAGVALRSPGTQGGSPAVVELETIVVLYRAGHTIKAIAGRTGLSEATVWRRLGAADEPTVKPGTKRPAPPLVDAAWCRAMQDDGHSVEEIAGWLGVSTDIIAAELALTRR